MFDTRENTTVCIRFWQVLIVAACAFALAFFLGGCSCSSDEPAQQETAAPISTMEPSSTPDAELENPIDFASLQQENADVYAWIYVPGTAVNQPILQNSLLDNYYLVHDYRGEYSEAGAVYTQSMNAHDFTDPVTLVYGHTFATADGVTDAMFGSLHNYEDEQFFQDHPTFYIYLPYKTLTYQVVSVYEYDNRHIMNSFDFTDPAVVQDYFNYVLAPDSLFKLVRDDVQLTAGEDRIVQLSTCTFPSLDSARFLVTGVLVDEQPV